MLQLWATGRLSTLQLGLELQKMSQYYQKLGLTGR